MLRKNVEEIGVSDWANFPVWEFTNADETNHDLLMRPVTELPVDNMNGRLVGSQVQLSGGGRVWAALGNLNLQDYEFTKHFLTVTVFQNNDRFTMSRYHDLDWDDNGPAALANFLGLSIDIVFPMSYDVSRFCVSQYPVTRGVIVSEPTERLTRSEVLKLVKTNV